MDLDTIIVGDALDVLRTLPAESVHCCVTSPPYWGLRDYGEPGQLGLESTPGEYVERIVGIFREVRRVLRGDGTLWLNLGSSYSNAGATTGGCSPKSTLSGGGGKYRKGSKNEAMFNASSRPDQNAAACGTDGTEPQDSGGADPACPCFGDGHLGDSPTRHDRTPRTPPRRHEAAAHHPPTVRDSVRSGFDSASQCALHRGAQASTTSASPPSARDACVPVDAASVCPQGPRTSSCDAPTCADTAENSHDRRGTSQPSDRRTSDTGSSSSASDPPALTMLYSTIASLGFKQKDMVPIPWLVALALQADGWYLRSDIIWAKPNPMPESVTDRPTKAHEYVFLLSKSARYFYDADAVREAGTLPPHVRDRRSNFKGESAAVEAAGMSPMARDGVIECDGTRNRRTVWTIATQPFPGSHFAVMPPALVRPCILAGCPPDGVVLDPFAGAGTVPLVAAENGRRYLGIELNPEYAEMARERVRLRGKTPVVDDALPGQRSLF